MNGIWRELDMAIQQHQPPEHGLSRTLDELFMCDNWRACSTAISTDERMDRLLQLLSAKIGARWHTYIRMNSGRRATRYLLLHLTNHDQGRDLMKECIWRVAPTGDFEIRQRDDPKQPLLIKPDPEQAPLRAWLLERLGERPRTRPELKQELRPTPWLPAHLKQVVERLLREEEIDESGGTLSRRESRQLSLL